MPVPSCSPRIARHIAKMGLLRPRSSRMRWLPILIGVGLLTCVLLGPLLHAKWQGIDDHEIMKFLGQDRKAHITELVALLSDTEVARLGSFGRYRPSYYIARALEAVAWGDSPRLWYLSRMVMFAISAALAWDLLARRLGVLAAGLVVLYLLTFRFWGDIWCGLGPAEQYAVLGTAMYAYGVFGLTRAARANRGLRTRGATAYWMLLVVPGALLAMGSKENFLFLLIPTWAVTVWLGVRHRLDRAALLGCALITAYGLFIGVAVAIAVGSAGRDVYLNPVGIGYRLALVPSGINRALVGIRWTDRLATAAAGGAAACLAVVAWRQRHARRAAAATVLVLVCLLLLNLSQFVFYCGQLPEHSRYAFPALLVWPGYWLALCVMDLRLLRSLAQERWQTTLAHLGLCLAVLALVAMERRGLTELGLRAELHAQRTQRFTEKITAICDRAKADPGRPIVLVSHLVYMDCEHCFSTQRFLHAAGIANPLYLDLRGEHADAAGLPPLEKFLHAHMAEVSRRGLEGFAPWATRPPEAACFAVGFSGDPGGDYVSLGRLNERTE